MVSEETKPKRLKEEERSINCLPHDCIEWIFVRLPVSTLLKCSGVCKQWYKLIRDSHFIAAHLEQAPRCALLFFPQKSVSGKRYPSDAIIFDEVWSQSTLAVPVIGPDDFLCGTCNGLLCLYTKTSKIKIANLATGECLHLDKPVKYLKGDHFSFYRFGFHPVTKEYKVTHFLVEHHYQDTFNIIQVYTLGSEKWRDIRTSEALSLSCVKNYGVVSVDGAMFWLTKDTGARWKHAVISFDLSEETFTRIQLPTAALGNSNSRRYWITEMDGKVCIATGEVHRHQPRILSGDLQIWMLDSKVEQKWSQMYNLPYTRNYLPPGPHFVHSDKILLQSRTCDLYSYELFGKNHETKSSDRVKLLDFSPCKPDNMQSYICVRSLVQLDAYKKVSIMHGTKQWEGWELKKWQMWKREIDEVEDAWRNVYEVEQNSVALPRHLGVVAKEVLLRLPDEVIRQRITAEVDQILQHLPDCPDQHLRSLRRLNWVERKWDSEKLSVRIDGAKDRAKASKQAHDDILWALSNVRDHLQGASSPAANTPAE